jgi:hypothetical protein
MMKNAYTCTALALSFMQGLAINDWVIQQTDWLYWKCNGDVMNGIALTHCTNDEWLWVEFGHNVHCTFANTASEQHAYRELANCIMGNKSIDEYIV